MKILNRALHSLRWNERDLTETDFFNLCRRNKVTVKLMPLRVEGFYYRVMGKDYIAIDSRLTPKRMLFVMFHEFGHYLLHAPAEGATANYAGLEELADNPAEREADAFALSCIFPLRLLIRKSTAELMSEEGYSRTAIDERRRVHERYGF